MVFRSFFSPEARKRRSDEVRYSDLQKLHKKRKLEFRINALNRLKLEHNDYQLISNLESSCFFAYSPSSRKFAAGHFCDADLPSLFELEKLIGSNRFDSEAVKFKESTEKRRTFHSFDFYGHLDGDGFSCIDDLCHPIDVIIRKNDVAIARSNFHKPKGLGYLRDSLYNNLVGDTSGGPEGTYVSTISIRIYYQYHSGVNFSTILYIFPDNPRVSAAQNSEYYENIVKHIYFPFLMWVDSEIRNPHPEVEAESQTPNERDLNDTFLGLPPS